MKERIAAERKLLTVPRPGRGREARLALRERLAREILVTKGDTTVFDFGEFKSEVASRRNPDGSSRSHHDPGFDGLGVRRRGAADKRTLVFRDAQHEYTFGEK